MISAELDKNAMDVLNQRIGAFVKHLNTDAAQTVDQTVKNIANTLTDNTPPYSKGEAYPKTNLAGKKLGETRIKDDILRTIRPVQDVFGPPTKSDSIAKLIRRRNSEGMKQILKRTTKESTPEIVSFDESYHTAKRSSPSGRYRALKGESRYTFDRTKVYNYIKKVQERVGYSKAGWHLSAVAFGEKPIGWLARHFAYVKAWYLQVGKNTPTYSVTIRNDAKGLRRHIPQYNRGLVSLADRMYKDFVIKMQHRIKQSNMGK